MVVPATVPPRAFAMDGFSGVQPCAVGQNTRSGSSSLVAVPATVPPRAFAMDGFSGVQPCAMGHNTRSARRRARTRRVAIRHSIRQAAELRIWSFSGSNDASTEDPSRWNSSEDWLNGSTSLNPEAAVFLPVPVTSSVIGVHIDKGSLVSTLDSADIAPGVRRCLRDTEVADSLPELPDLPDSFAVNAIFVPERRLAKETQLAEVFPDIATPDIAECAVVSDILPEVRVQAASSRTISELKGFQCSSSLIITEPTRMYKQPLSNRTLRGLDVRGIGEEHVCRDNPMMIEGIAKVHEIGEARIKVSGKARAEVGGQAFRLIGWIEKKGFDLTSFRLR